MSQNKFIGLSLLYLLLTFAGAFGIGWFGIRAIAGELWFLVPTLVSGVAWFFAFRAGGRLNIKYAEELALRKEQNNGTH